MAELAWNLGSLPSDARDAALTCANQEGVPVGEWMKRQILRGFTELQARNQLQLVDELSLRVEGLNDRIDRIEPQENAGSIRDAVKNLHHELAQVVDDVGRSSQFSASQISSLMDDLKAISAGLEALRNETSHSGSEFNRHLAQTAGQLTVQIAALGSKLEAVNAKHENSQTWAFDAAKKLEERLANTQASLHALDSQHAQSAQKFVGDLSALATRFDESQGLANETIGGLQQRLALAFQNLEKLDATTDRQAAALDDRFATLDGNLASHRDEISQKNKTLDTRVDRLRAELSNRITQEGEAVQSLACDVGVLRDKLDETRAQAADKHHMLEWRLGIVQQDLVKVDERHDEAARNITGRVEAIASEWQNAAEMLSQKIAQDLDELRAEDNRQTADLQNFEHRFVTIEGAVSTRAESLDRHLAEEAATVADRFQTLAARLDDVQARSALAADSAEQRFGQSRYELQSLADRHDGLAQTLTQRFDSVEADHAAHHQTLHRRIDTADRFVADLGERHANETSALRDGLEVASSKLQELGERHAVETTALRDGLDVASRALHEVDERHAGETAALRGGLGVVSQTLHEFDQRHTGETAALQSGLDAVSRKLNQLGAQSADVAKGFEHRLEHLESAQQPLEASQSDFSRELAQTRDALKSEADARYMHLDQRVNVLDRTTGQIGALFQRLGQLESSAPVESDRIDASLEHLRQAGHEIETRLGGVACALADDLKALAAKFKAAEQVAPETDVLRPHDILPLRRELENLDDRQQMLARSLATGLEVIDVKIAEVQSVSFQSGHALNEQMLAMRGELDALRAGQTATIKELFEKFAGLHGEALAKIDNLVEQLAQLREPRPSEDAQQVLIEHVANLDRRRDSAEARLIAPEVVHPSAPPEHEVAVQHDNVAMTPDSIDLFHIYADAVDGPLHSPALPEHGLAEPHGDLVTEPENVDAADTHADVVSEPAHQVASPECELVESESGVAKPAELHSEIADERVDRPASPGIETPESHDDPDNEPDLIRPASAEASHEPSGAEPPAHSPAEQGYSVHDFPMTDANKHTVTPPEAATVAEATTVAETAKVTEAAVDTEAAADGEPSSAPELSALSQDDAQRLAPVAIAPDAPEAKSAVPSYLSEARRAAQAASIRDVEAPRGRRTIAALKLPFGGSGSARVALFGTGAAVIAAMVGAQLWLSHTPEQPHIPGASLAVPPKGPVNVSGKPETSSGRAASAAASTTRQNRAASAVGSVAPLQAAESDHDKLTRLANAGDRHAELILGLQSFADKSNPASGAEAAKWLERAAGQGDADAEYHLGMMYQSGRGVPADDTVATQWYLAAANQGNRDAMNNLGVAYALGHGEARDYSDAAHWFSQAANLGLVEAQFDLAVLYERGRGVPQSLPDAYRWYTIAAKEGDVQSKSRAETLATQISAADREAEDRVVASFAPAGTPENSGSPNAAR